MKMLASAFNQFAEDELPNLTAPSLLGGVYVMQTTDPISNSESCSSVI